MTPPTKAAHAGIPQAELRRVQWSTDLGTVRRLFEGYRQWIADHRDPSPSSQPRVESGLAEVDRLLRELPGAYGPPRGEVLLWFDGDEVVACGALRELAPGIGEIKRVYVRPDFRGKTFGHPFVRALMDRARELGYAVLRADTLPSMTAAIEFYQELGFRPVPAYWPHPVEGALFFERRIVG